MFKTKNKGSLPRLVRTVVGTLRDPFSWLPWSRLQFLFSAYLEGEISGRPGLVDCLTLFQGQKTSTNPNTDLTTPMSAALVRMILGSLSRPSRLRGQHRGLEKRTLQLRATAKSRTKPPKPPLQHLDKALEVRGTNWELVPTHPLLVRKQGVAGSQEPNFCTSNAKHAFMTMASNGRLVLNSSRMHRVDVYVLQ